MSTSVWTPVLLSVQNSALDMLTPYRTSFTILDQASRKWYCSYLHQELVYSLEQVELMGLVCRCSAMAEKVKRVTELDWLWCLHQ